jgi:plasmid stabilization system protein ParE
MPERNSIEILPPTRSELLEIISYISQSRPTAAEGLCRTLIEAISELERLPLQGPLVPDLTVLTGIEIRRLLISSYSVLYSCKGGRVVVYRVLHQSRDIQLNPAMLGLLSPD